MADKYPRFAPLFADQLEKSPPEDPLVLGCGNPLTLILNPDPHARWFLGSA